MLAWLKWVFVLLPVVCFAENAVSIGDVAGNILAPVTGVKGLFEKVCLVIGIGMVFGSFIQYRMHRRNPTQVRLSTPFLWLILGLMGVAVPYLGQIAQSGFMDRLTH